MRRTADYQGTTAGRTRLLMLATVAFAGCSESTTPADTEPGPPTAIAISSGDAQSGAAGMQLPLPIAVKVTDANSRGVPAQRVDFFVTAGDGDVLDHFALTNSFGV